MLAGASELADAPAIVDVPVGRGHVVLFATNPMWRQETQGEFMLLLNAALNFDHLNAGRKAPLPAAEKASSTANETVIGRTLQTSVSFSAQPAAAAHSSARRTAKIVLSL